ncbi:hypothetical protein Tco_1122225 [Tanacetum coccineum]|uniref:Uncharacterized protein n=1 Tax=Tanacetum coccineum TaxID=301880 RepID=A0ABQ5J1K8_9ASTR
MVIRKCVEDLQLRIVSYQTKLNLTQPDWDVSDFLFKEDYTIVSKPRAVIYKDRNDQKKMMRETEVHKFSDGMLNMILDKLDHMVKDFKLFKYNPGMETRIWSEDNRRRSKEFMENRRDLPRDNPLVSVEVLRYDIKRSKSENKGIVPTEMELVLEQTEQGTSHEVSNIRVIIKYHGEDGNPARANIKQALGSFQDQERYEHVGPQDTRPQDGERSQDDDQRLYLADDLNKAEDHIPIQATRQRSLNQSTRYHMKNQRLRAEHKINKKIVELKLVFSGVTSLRGDYRY